jgi:hypothetical protein
MNSEYSHEDIYTPQPGDDAAPITLKDVLRAVFLPPRDEEAIALPDIPPPREWARPQIARTPPLPQPDSGALDAPTALHYEDSPIAPVADANPTRMLALGLGTVAALLFGYLAQSTMTGQGSGFGGALLYGLALVAWLGILMFEIAPPDGGLLRRGPRVTGGAAARPLTFLSEAALNTRVIIALTALALAILTYVFTTDNTFTRAGVITWIVSVIGWLVASAERGPRELLADFAAWLKRLRLPRPTLSRHTLTLIAACVAIMGVAAFYRFYRLDAIPNEMTSDHVEKLLDSYDIAEQGIYHVFFTRNAGREAIQFYLVALASRAFGTGMSFISLKLVSAIEALVLIPLMILLGRELVDRETGLFAAALVAVSWWHVMLGRLALRIVLTPLLLTPLLLTLIRGIRTGSRKAWLWAGVWMGVGVYGYQSLRITPLVALAAFLAAVLGPITRAATAHLKNQPDADYLRTLATNTTIRQAINLALAGLVALAIFTPMLRVWHDYPAQLWDRVINRTTSSEVPIQGSPAGVFARNYADALLMFNLKGDSSWFSALLGAPMLDLFTGILFVLGLAAWLVRLRVRRDPVDAFILIAALVMLLPSALSIAFPLENPSATRASGVIPVVFLLAAWPLSLIRQRWSAVLGRLPGVALTGLLIAALLGGAALVNYNTYFVKYAVSYRNSALNPGEVADAVREQIGPDAPLDGVWLQGWPFWHDYRAIGIEAGDITFDQAIMDVPTLVNYLDSFPQSFAVRPLVFIVHPLDLEALGILEERFPEGSAQRYASATEGRDFVLYVVPAPGQ